MTSEKSFSFIKRWRVLEEQRKDLNYQRCVLAREIRAEFAEGESGDLAFASWCDVELGVRGLGATEMLVRAQSMELLKDRKTFERVGGYTRGIRHLLMLPRRERVAVIEAAKTQQKAIATVLRERGHGPAPRTSSVRDLKLVAEYLAKSGRRLPPEISVVVDRWAVSARLKAVA